MPLSDHRAFPREEKMSKWYHNSNYAIYNADSLEWLQSQRANSFHAVVTDPPFGIIEYTAKELRKRRNGVGGIWRLPNAFDGAKRQPTPRFTVLDGHDRMGLFAFHLRLAPELFRVLVLRAVRTLRGGDRPKFGEKQFRNVSVIPRSCYEPWLLFRKPCEGKVAENLRRFGTGALRRPSENVPFSDFVEVPPARSRERELANHPSLKPQALMRILVRAALPLGKGIVLDPFMGAGSTIAAAHHLGLKSVGVELDGRYFALAKSAIPKLSDFQISA